VGVIFMDDRVYVKSTLHSIAPYVGKLRPELANTLINEFSKKNDLIFDPFSGSGTVSLEAWINNRNTVSVDLNFYAFLLSKAKLYPYPTYEDAKKKYEKYYRIVESENLCFDLRKVPKETRNFFHNKTTKEIMAWSNILLKHKEWFFLACLMGILHHQRPGFLSYPSSHGAPYLRTEKFPQDEYPELYEYRSVADRLLSKVKRTYNEIPDLNYSKKRDVFFCNTLNFNRLEKQNIAIISSPPYMKSLTYARDNRLRLWFLGYPEWKKLDKKISIGKQDFLNLMRKCFKKWYSLQKKGNYCILVIGDIEFEKKAEKRLPDVICEQAEMEKYATLEIRDYPISTDRKFEKKDSQIKMEKICILRRN
jgi:hypothetical protein